MRHILIIFIVLLFIHIGSFAQIKQNITNPVYLGMVLIDQPNVDRMTEVCEYYNLTDQPDENGYKMFRHFDGTEFLFMVDDTVSRHYPVVKIYSKKSAKEIDKILSNAGYVKQSGDYVKGSKFEHRRTRCKISGGATKTLTFTKEYRAED